MSAGRRECLIREYERLFYHEGKVEELHLDTSGAGKVFGGVMGKCGLCWCSARLVTSKDNCSHVGFRAV